MPPAHGEQGSMLMQSRSSQRILVSTGFAKAKYSQLPLLDLGAALQSENHHYDPPSCRIISHSTPPPPQIPSKYSLTVYTSKLIWPLFLRERTQVCSFSTACLPYLGLPGETDSRNGHLNKRSPVACVPTSWLRTTALRGKHCQTSDTITALCWSSYSFDVIPRKWPKS